MLYALAMQRNAQYFEAPEEFRPERWEGQTSRNIHMMPFGYGPRACIGRKLAELELKVATLYAVHHFDITVQPEDANVGLAVEFTLQPDRDIKLSLAPAQ